MIEEIIFIIFYGSIFGVIVYIIYSMFSFKENKQKHKRYKNYKIIIKGSLYLEGFKFHVKQKENNKWKLIKNIRFDTEQEAHNYIQEKEKSKEIK